MKVDFQQIVNFVLKWLAIGLVLHFGLKIGGILDGLMTFI